MLLRKKIWHQYIHIVSYNFLLYKFKAIIKALTDFQNTSTRFSYATYMNNSRIFCEKNLWSFDVILYTFLYDIYIMSSVKVVFACLLIVSYESKIFTI